MGNARTPTRRSARSVIAIAALLMLSVPAAVGGGQALPALQATAGLLGASWKIAPRWPPPLWLIAIGVFLAWLGLASLWSPVQSSQWPRLILTILAGSLCIQAARHLQSDRKVMLFWLACFCCAALAVLSAVEVFGAPLNRLTQPHAIDWVLNRNPAKGVVILICMSAPLIASLLGAGLARTAFAGALALATAWLSLQFENAANALALVVSLTLGLLAFAAPRTIIAGGAVLCAFWALAAPWALRLLPLTDGLPYSWAARLHVWRFTADQVASKPLFGWGMDASRSFSDQVVVVQGHTHPALPLHPHNMFTQVWLESGLIGAALLASAIFLCGWTAARSPTIPRRAAAGAVSLVGAAFVYANLSFGAWQEWWIGSVFFGALILTLAAARARQRAAPHQ